VFRATNNSGNAIVKTLEILDRLIAFPTVSADSNLAIIDYIQDYLKARGFETHRILDQTGLKAGLFARIGPSEGAGIMLSGHTDVVPTTGQKWATDPFKMKVANDKAYGRGATDMKGYLASVMALADRASKTNLAEPLKITFSYDEEIGCVGIKSMIDRVDDSIGLPRYCFVGEPTSMQVAVGHKGKAALRATCYGTSGHSAIAPKFLNALHLATDFILELRNLQDDYARNGVQDHDYSVPYSTLHVGKMSGGMALNIVPDKAVIDFEFRHLATDSPDDILTRILAAAKKASTSQQAHFPSAKIDILILNAYPGLDTDANDEVVRYAQKLTQATNTTKVAFGTEAGYFSGYLGVPTIVCGPGSMEGQGHKPDEYIELSQLVACDAMFNRLLNGISD
jgi:acetylornithine deacetylase